MTHLTGCCVHFPRDFAVGTLLRFLRRGLNMRLRVRIEKLRHLAYIAGSCIYRWFIIWINQGGSYVALCKFIQHIVLHANETRLRMNVVHIHVYIYTIKKTCRNPSIFDLDNDGTEPNVVRSELSVSHRIWFCPTVVHLGILYAFYSVENMVNIY
jgi:hypothetical protein